MSLVTEVANFDAERAKSLLKKVAISEIEHLSNLKQVCEQYPDLAQKVLGMTPKLVKDLAELPTANLIGYRMLTESNDPLLRISENDMAAMSVLRNIKEEMRFAMNA